MKSENRSGWLVLAVALLVAGCARRQPDALELLARTDFSWATDSSAHFVYHAERGSTAHERMPIVMARMEQALARVLDVLGLESYGPRIHVFMVDARPKMRRLTGRSTNAIAFHRTNVVALTVTASWSTLTPHEVLHVVAMNEWGRAETWLNEGLAVYAAGEWRGRDVHELARELAAQRRLIPMGRLVANFRAHDDQVAYPQAGSFVRFLYEKYGRDAVAAAWRTGASGLPEVTGRSLAELEDEWLVTIR